MEEAFDHSRFEFLVNEESVCTNVLFPRLRPFMNCGKAPVVIVLLTPFVFQDASWTTRENCLKDSVIVSSIAIEELGF